MTPQEKFVRTCIKTVIVVFFIGLGLRLLDIFIS